MKNTFSVRKNEIIELAITDLGAGGEGVGRYEGFAFFVKDALPGDRVKAVVTKINKGYGFAKMTEVVEPSANRVEPPCSAAQRCGGCQIMQLNYKEQLRLKEGKVRNDLERIGGFKDVKLRPIIGMEPGESIAEPFGKGAPDANDPASQTFCPLHFRNKVQFPVGRSEDGRVITGFYAGRTHYIIETESCPVSPREADIILAVIRVFLEENNISVYDENSGKGLVRHVLIRFGARTGQIMVCLVINGENLYMQGASGTGMNDAFVQTLIDTGLNITCVCLNINKEKTNVILGRKTVTLYGSGYIEDKIGELTFRISPVSFFQVNSTQTEKLYSKALEYAQLTGSESVWDLYCGAGTISLFLAQRAKQVYGVEIVPQAIEDARVNAQINEISNVRFFCGKSEEVFPEMCASGAASYAAPDVVVLDPPRKGCDRTLLDAILKVEPKRVVYVSCSSSTLARDLKILSEKYFLEEATPCDMFPNSVHVETVCLLSNRKYKPDAYVDLSLDMEDYRRIKAGSKE